MPGAKDVGRLVEQDGAVGGSQRSEDDRQRVLPHVAYPWLRRRKTHAKHSLATSDERSRQKVGASQTHWGDGRLGSRSSVRARETRQFLVTNCPRRQRVAVS